MALSCPSTDFPLTVFMYRALSEAGQEVFGAVAVSVRALWRVRSAPLFANLAIIGGRL